MTAETIERAVERAGGQAARQAALLAAGPHPKVTRRDIGREVVVTLIGPYCGKVGRLTEVRDPDSRLRHCDVLLDEGTRCFAPDEITPTRALLQRVEGGR